MKESRDTIQRRVVLETVRQLKNHPTADEVYDRALLQLENVSRRTVYRNLNLLAQRGEIRKVRIPGAADRFDFTLTPHHHIRCRACGRVFDVRMEPLEDLRGLLCDDGFLVEEYDVVFSGLCPDCQ